MWDVSSMGNREEDNKFFLIKFPPLIWDYLKCRMQGRITKMTAFRLASSTNSADNNGNRHQRVAFCEHLKVYSGIGEFSKMLSYTSASQLERWFIVEQKLLKFFSHVEFSDRPTHSPSYFLFPTIAFIFWVLAYGTIFCKKKKKRYIFLEALNESDDLCTAFVITCLETYLISSLEMRIFDSETRLLRTAELHVVSTASSSSLFFSMWKQFLL